VRAALDDKLGSLREGLLADMVAVAGDPAPDISRVRDVRFVMQGGRVVRAVP
jgi:imidazolonepropionase-like amidohydrolase